MKNYKEINGIYNGSPFGMVGDGFRVTNYFPNGNRLGKQISPFFLLDYNPPIDFPPAKSPRGVGVHPHKGFETVTIAFEGSVAHHDSSGNSGIIRPGDVQWMTAASGILHKEYHEKKFAESGGIFHMIQLWVNLPKKYKKSPPKYQTLLREDMGKYELEDNGGVVTVIAGDYKNVKGPASTFTPINLYKVELKKDGKFNASFAENFNTGILIAQGNVKINETKNAKELDFILFENKGENILIEGNEDSMFVVFNGEPIDEPVASYGPFVMNTMEEINEAINDFNAGKFGQLSD